MNRRRTYLAAGEFADTLQGAAAFCAALAAQPASARAPRRGCAALASDGDVYAVYCKLHLARRATQVGCSADAGCFYLLAGPRRPLPEPLPEPRPRRGKQRAGRGAAGCAGAQPAQPAAAEAPGHAAAAEPPPTSGAGPNGARADAAAPAAPDELPGSSRMPSDSRAAAGSAGATAAIGDASGSLEHPPSPDDAPAGPGSGQGRSEGGAGEALWEVVVPVSTSSRALTPARMQRMLGIPAAAGQPAGGGGGVVLAMADRDGTVGFSRLHGGLVPPAEGPPSAPA
jgi:hypothetical protein